VFLLRVVLMLIVATGGVVLAPAAVAHTGESPGGMHELLRYLHVVLLVFWLGPEVATLVAGQHAIRATLNAAQRVAAARMMGYYEIMPRVCMSLMLTVGGALSEQVGLDHPWWQSAAIWLLGPVWLTLTVAAHFGAATGAGAIAERLEQALRIVIVLAVPVSVAYSITAGRLAAAPYVGGKLLLFALIALLSLLARRAHAPFRDGVRELAADNGSPGLDLAMRASVARGRPFVLAIWVALLLAALLGVVQPGAQPVGPG